MVKTTLTVDGMMCPMCESHVNDAVRGAMTVKKVTSSHKKGVTEIISPDAPDEQTLRAAIEATGYRVLSYTTVPYEKHGLFGRK
ncbi:MAG: cation transporter [Oscillospiraceae bacterium]|nr:cation transporter [Oscillospiraceae bacterium]